MTIQGFLNGGISYIMKQGGLDTTISLITFTFDSGSYDDDVTQTLTGSQVVSGLVFPVGGTNNKNNSSVEAMLLEQGKLLTKDKVVYTGSVSTSGNILVDIQGDKYTVIPDGVQRYDINGSTVYNKFYIRHTITGSLF